MANKYVQKIEFQAKTKDLERQIKKSEKSLGGLKASALAVGAALGTMGALAMKSVNAFAEFEGVNRGFKELSRNAGFSSQSLSKLKRATDNTVDSITLMKQANNALLLGIVENEDELAGLMDTAQRLGRALGLDTAQAVESLTTGMGRQSKLMLDNLGIIVDTEKAYQNFAIAQGTTVSLLTDEQKKRAFNIETMRTAEEMIKGLGDEEMLTTKDSLNQISNAFNEMAISVGQRFAPAISAVADMMTSLTETTLEEEVNAERQEFEKLVLVLKDTNTSTRARSLALEKLKSEYGAYLGDLEKEEDILHNLDAIQRNFLDTTTRRIAQKRIEAEVEGHIAKKLEHTQELLDAEADTARKRNRLKEAEIKFDGQRTQGIDVYLRRLQQDLDSAKLREAQITTNIKLSESEVQQLLARNELLIQASERQTTYTKVSLEGIDTTLKTIDMNSFLLEGLKDIEIQTFKNTQAIVKNREAELKMLEIQKDEIQTQMQLGAAFTKSKDERKDAIVGIIKQYALQASAAQALKVLDNPTIPFPFNVALSASASIAAGAFIEHLASKAMSAQTGASYITGGEQMLQVGEAGAEEVNVTPLDDPTGGSSATGGSTVVINNPMLTESVIEDEIIPMIQRAIDRGAELN